MYFQYFTENIGTTCIETTHEEVFDKCAFNKRRNMQGEKSIANETLLYVSSHLALSAFQEKTNFVAGQLSME